MRRYTTTGRVVYERKPHYYEVKDFRRIFKAVFSRHPVIGDIGIYFGIIVAVVSEYLNAVEGDIFEAVLFWIRDYAVERGTTLYDQIKAWFVNNMLGGRIPKEE